MRKIVIVSLTSIFFILNVQCKKEPMLAPPVGTETLKFTKNSNIGRKIIYQSEGDYTFLPGQNQHRYWVGIHGKPSYRLHLKLLSNSKDILFTVFFPTSKKKVFCETIPEKNMIGYIIPEKTYAENEFIIEVLCPKGSAAENKLNYRLFTGIQSGNDLDFISVKK